MTGGKERRGGTVGRIGMGERGGLDMSRATFISVPFDFASALVFCMLR